MICSFARLLTKQLFPQQNLSFHFWGYFRIIHLLFLDMIILNHLLSLFIPSMFLHQMTHFMWTYQSNQLHCLL